MQGDIVYVYSGTSLLRPPKGLVTIGRNIEMVVLLKLFYIYKDTVFIFVGTYKTWL